ncbi:MAG: CehA/McbA family metallohydrolase [Verrucomicrobiaceae bacterium]
MNITLLTCAALCVLSVGRLAAAEAFEIGNANESELPQGKEADGIRGDFVLRNDKVEALISQNAPLRRANMSTFYGADGVTPGCLFDLTLRGSHNDQLIYFGPAAQRGQVSWVRILPGSKDKKAAVETVITSAKSGGLFKRHEYRLRDGEQGLWILTTIRNEGTVSTKVSTKDSWTRFNETGERDGILWADAVDPADKAGYAHARLPFENLKPVADEVELAPKQEVTWARFLAVGRSPAEAWGIVQQMRGTKTGTVSGSVLGPDGQPVTTARVSFVSGKSRLAAYPDAQGSYTVNLPAGEHQVLVEDVGRVAVEQSVTVASGKDTSLVSQLKEVSRVRFAITDVQGQFIPCKVQFLAQDGTPVVDLGPVMRAHGCKDQWHSERGDFSVPLHAGSYRVVVTRGIEFSHHEQTVTLAQGGEIEVKATLRRLVDTSGWVSADFHNHSTPSGDNICGTPDRVINLAAEHIEFAPTTEHNRIIDWRPTIEKLGLLDEIQTVTGMELTGSAAHLNCFPLTPEPFTQDGGAPVYNMDARISALTLQGWQGERKDRWIQINHPSLEFLYNDRNLDGQADGGLIGLTGYISGVETENFVGEGILADSPWVLSRASGALATKVTYVRQFIWLQLLNQGHRINPVAVADAHTVYGNGVGGWRMYLPSVTDEPAKIDWTADLAAHALAGHATLTTGPFLQVSTVDGKMPGDDVKAQGDVQLKVKVQCTDWLDIDRVQVLVNSRKEPTLNFTRQTHPQMFADGVVKFEQTLNVPLKADAHLIVVVLDEDGNLKTGYGTSDQATMRPMAYHTPFYVDVDGNGFQANGDTLGYEIPVAKMTPDVVRAKLGKPE